MPSSLTYPGVYVEEIPSGVRTITAVPTSITAFVGRARKGPTNEAVEITSFEDFERIFGGLWAASAMSFAVRDFYLNGGNRAVIVRVFSPNYVDDSTRTSAEAAAKRVGDKAAAKNNGKDAKDAAKAENDTIQGDATLSPQQRAAAAAAWQIIKTLADDANKETVGSTAKAATVGTVRTITIGDDPNKGARFAARSPGAWATTLRVIAERPFDAKGKPSVSATDAAASLGVDVKDLFTLTVVEDAPSGAREVFQNVTLVDSTRRVDRVLLNGSALVIWAGANLGSAGPKLADIIPDPKATEDKYVARKGDEVTEAEVAFAAIKQSNPDQTSKPYTDAQKALKAALDNAQASVGDGGQLEADDIIVQGADKKGLHALEQLFTRGGLFNLLCIPPYADGANVDGQVLDAAVLLCEKRRALFIVDPPVEWSSVSKAAEQFGVNEPYLPRTRNAAVYFPDVVQPNPLRNGQLQPFPPCGIVAGIYARTDTQRGVWKSPAGLDASLRSVSGLSVPMTDEENGRLNPLGINCLRTFPIFGRVVWGARTLRGADDYADEYKYVAVRRTALYIEESLFRGLKWVVFEPNDEPLWAQIRLNVGAFMHNLFRQGAFAGASPREAYFVKCDKSTTTQNDINLGIVNIVVGFAPLKPAEFVVIKLQQMAGQIEA